MSNFMVIKLTVKIYLLLGESRHGAKKLFLIWPIHIKWKWSFFNIKSQIQNYLISVRSE